MNKLDQFEALHKLATTPRADNGENIIRLMLAVERDAPAFLNLARTADDCVTKLGYLEPQNLTDTERHVMRQLRGALAPLLAESQ